MSHTSKILGTQALSTPAAKDMAHIEYSLQDAKKVVSPYYQDTLSSMQHAPLLPNGDPRQELKVEDSLALDRIPQGNWQKFCGWIKGFFVKKETSQLLTSLLATPASSSPPPNVPQKNLDLYTEEMQEINRRLREMNEIYEEHVKQGNTNAAEAVVMRLLTMMVKAQVKNKEIKTTLTYDQFNRNQQTVSETLEAKDEHQKDLTHLKQRKKVLDGTALALGVLSGVGALASIAFTLLATGGLAGLPVAVAATNAILGVATAGTTVTKGITDHMLSKKEKETYLLNTQKELAKEGISMNIREIDQTYNEIATYWNMLKDVAEKQRATIHALSRI